MVARRTVESGLPSTEISTGGRLASERPARSSTACPVPLCGSGLGDAESSPARMSPAASAPTTSMSRSGRSARLDGTAWGVDESGRARRRR